MTGSFQGFADLHLHTNFSDGSCSPRRVVERAKELGFSAIAITDHDTMEGLREALDAGKELGLEVIPGVEISSTCGDREIHILGYYVRPEEEPLKSELERIRRLRRARAHNILRGLREQGLPVDPQEMVSSSDGASLGRVHIAQFLLKKGIVWSKEEAFQRYIGSHCPAYETVNAVDPAGAVRLLNGTGAITALAHPGKTAADELINSLQDAGLMGIEVYHPSHSLALSRYYLGLAKGKGLLVVGGSDCHGPGVDEELIGRVKLPMAYVEDLKGVLPEEENWEWGTEGNTPL